MGAMVAAVRLESVCSHKKPAIKRFGSPMKFDSK